MEVVSSYEYLGVPFSNSATFKTDTDSAMSKTNLAVGTTSSLINRLNLKTWEPVNRLFVSLVTNTFFYAIPIWGLRYIDEIKKIQTSFYKKVLLLPKNTTGYALRFELGSTKLSATVFRLTLSFIEKIFSMNDDRYPKICFLRLKSLARGRKPHSKYNWCEQVGYLFELIEERNE